MLVKISEIMILPKRLIEYNEDLRDLYLVIGRWWKFQ